MDKKLIATAIGGLGLGALLSWAVTADYYEQKLLRREDHIRYLRTKQHEWAMSAVVPPAEREEELDSEPENPRGDETTEIPETDEVQEVEEQQPDAIRSNLENLIREYSPDPFVEQVVTAAEGSRTPPYVISREAYSWDEEGDGYEKITVTYYPRDRVILEDDEVLEDPNHVLGWKNLNRFGDDSGDPDVVFIRNRDLETDYEVVKDEDSPLPLHVKYGMDKDMFEVSKAAGTLRLREEDL